MKKCNVNGNHLYSNHLTQCPWCDIKKATGEDHFPDSTGMQMAMPAPVPKVPTPVINNTQSKTYIPPPTPAPTSIGGKWFFGLIIILAVLALDWYGTQDSSSTVTPQKITPYVTTTSIMTAKATPSAASVVASSTDQKTITNSIGMEFVSIPAGEFDMGSPSNDKDDNYYEVPVHRVKISKAFYMGKYEVTQKQWRDVMGNNPSYFKGDNLPVEGVSWNDVQDFVKKLNEKELSL